MAFITTTNLRDRLASFLRVSTSSTTIDSSSPWNQFVTDSVDYAYQQIVTALRKRGYTKTQIDSWVQGAEYNMDIASYWLLVKGAGLHAYDDKFISRLDRRLELETVILYDSNYTLISPSAGRINTGPMSTSTDHFVLDDEDTRIGEPSEF